MNSTNWKYSPNPTNTRRKDTEDEMRSKIKGSGVSRSSGVKTVETSTGTSVFAVPGAGKRSATGVASWL